MTLFARISRLFGVGVDWRVDPAAYGEALRLGAGGRRFKSCLPDQREAPLRRSFSFGRRLKYKPAMYCSCTVSSACGRSHSRGAP